MNLYIDIGNSKCKILHEIKENKIYKKFLTKDLLKSRKYLKSYLQSLKNIKFKKIIISSVVPNLNFKIAKVITQILKVTPQFLSYKSKTNLQKIVIKKKNEIGPDLIALASFVANKTNNGIMINLGTAMTIIHVKNQILKGVIISPGITSSIKAIFKSAKLINEINLKFVKKNVGNDTAEALSIGILQGIIYQIQNHVQAIDSEAKIFISGGEGKEVAKKINLKNTYIEEATLEGVKIISNLI